MDAMSRVKNKDRLKKADLWSIRWAKSIDGEYVMANAKPCIHCKNLALKMGIKTCYYSNDDGKIVKQNMNDVDSKYTVGSVIQMRKNGHSSIPFRRTYQEESSSKKM